ncbi:MAG: DEAD/DEAH box helicase [Solirubrobacteraceae bacterium]
MIVLHAVWSRDSRLCVWAEDSERPATAPRRRGRPPVKPRARAHPFAAGVAHIRAALTTAGIRDRKIHGAEDTAVLRLPSSADGPGASPHIRHGVEAVGAAPWVVPVLAFPAAAALDVLLASPPRSGPVAPGVAVGDALPCLATVGKLALELLARGRALPGLSWRDEAWAATWEPVLTDPLDAARVHELGISLPAMVYADADDKVTAQDVVASVLGALVDASARGFLGAGLLARRRGRRRRTAVEAWLSALTAVTPEIDADEVQLAALAEAVEAWRSAGERYAEHRMVRTCFRLCEPGDAVDTWRVEILLQAKDDATAFVGADEVWNANGTTLTGLGRRVEDPQERLLGGLGHAVRLWPGLEPALHEAAPTGIDLDSAGAIAFLRDATAALEQAGFGVLVPQWWSRRPRPTLEVEPMDEIEAGSGLFGLDGLCRYEWKISIGDLRLSLAELRELAALKLPLIQTRGEWIVLRPEDIDAALAFFSSRSARGEAPARELLREGIGLGRETALPATEVDASGWLRELFSGDGHRALRPVPTPSALQGELRPYQQRGLAWLSFLSGLGLGACLADDMGLGKTVQLLSLLLAEREHAPRDRKRHPPTLLVCPMSVVGNWQRETQRFAPSLRVHVHHGPERLDGALFSRAARASDLVLTTYAIATRDRDRLAAVKWGRIALDEAQNIKTIDAKQTKAIRSLPAAHRVALTGTPVENRLTELHSIIDFLNPGLLGPVAAFKRDYARPIERYRDADATARLRNATQPFILRRLKTDTSIISDLPEKIEMRIDCHLTKEQATLYQAVVDEMLLKAAAVTGIERSGVILGALMKLKQVCNHPAHLLKDRSALSGRSGKLERLEEIVDEALGEGDRVLCFTQFTEFGHLLRAHLEERFGREVLFLHGGTARPARDEMVARFQDDPDGPAVFLLSLKAGGTGLNLTRANHVVHFDRWWNPAVENQATDRAFRIGQRKNVQVRKLNCVGTLEERIDLLISQKQGLADRIVGSGEAWITELDAAQLRELVTLSSDAVAA